jgi:hypothetical protein
MRTVRTGIAAAVVALALGGPAAVAQPLAQPPAPVLIPVPPNQLYERYPGMPLGGPWAVSPNTGTVTGGGYDVQFGYWVRGGFSDNPSNPWPGPAYTPVASPPYYYLSHPQGTGFTMGPATGPAPGGPFTYTLRFPTPLAHLKHKACEK